VIDAPFRGLKQIECWVCRTAGSSGTDVVMGCWRMIAGNLVGGIKWGESFERHEEAVTSEGLEQEARDSVEEVSLRSRWWPQVL
jgi:hypothetical protein